MSYENYVPVSEGSTLPPELRLGPNSLTSRQEYAKKFRQEYAKLESRDARANLLKAVIGHLTAHAGLDFGKDHIRFATDPDDEYAVEEWTRVLARHSALTVESVVEEIHTGSLKTVTVYL
ncbi:hypothetical protein [Halogeometricum sp. CBA1124]|uniref:hypothetical protein n=1 Tax=Halogeometricum sp. CBA1124 TaxID=2668071 RepID=UPI0018D225B6|nr:hypothetical protein [Halogeometricum sp. CBA1124]